MEAFWGVLGALAAIALPLALAHWLLRPGPRRGRSRQVPPPPRSAGDSGRGKMP